MQKFYFLIVLLLPFHFSLTAQWNQIPATNNTVITGGFLLEESISDGLGGTILIFTAYESNGDNDIYAQKIDANGNVAWAAGGVPVCVFPGNQRFPRAVTDGNGGAIVTWLDGRSIPGNSLIYCQRITALGNPQWITNGVPILNLAINASSPQKPTLVSNGNGGAIITWQDVRQSGTVANPFGIYAQLIDGNGNTQWLQDGVRICATSNWSLASPQLIAEDSEHGAIITWQDNSGINGNIFAQRIDAFGILKWQANGVLICNAINHPTGFQVVKNDIKGGIFSWMDFRNGIDFDLYAQSVDSAGLLQWPVDGLPVNQTGSNNYQGPVIDDGHGGAVFVWQDYRQNLDYNDGEDTVHIYAQRIDRNGIQKWTNGALAVCNIASRQTFPTVAYDTSDAYIFTWTDYRNDPFGGMSEIYAQRVDSNGITACPANGIAVSTVTSSKSFARVVNNFRGEGIIAWNDYRPGAEGTYISKVVWQINATPSITISASATNICPSVIVNFTSTVSNAGNNPVYQWKKNGLNVGTNSNTFTDASLNDQDIVYCVLDNNDLCNPSIVNSNSVTITVSVPTVAEISISTMSSTVCSLTTATFTATTVNANPIPFYQWLKNGINTGTNSRAYTDNSLLNGDIISCVLHSINNCNVLSLITSNSITITVINSDLPSVIIQGSGNDICPGLTVNFTTTTINAGNNPVYNWKKNGISTGTNASVYSDNNLTNGDVINCVLQSDANCASPAVVSSNNIIMIVRHDLPGSINLGADISICAGDTTIIQPAGNYSNYLWDDNSTASTHTVNHPGIYYVTATDACQNIYSDTINVFLYSTPSHFLPDAITICEDDFIILKPTGNYNQFLWSTNAYTSSIKVTRPGLYWLKVTDNRNCIGTDTVLVKFKECIKGFYIPASFTPNGDAINKSFKPLLFGNLAQYKFSIYDRYGEIVFTSAKSDEGWNGAVKGTSQNTSTFVWICTYQFRNEIIHTVKGTVLLIK